MRLRFTTLWKSKGPKFWRNLIEHPCCAFKYSREFNSSQQALLRAIILVQDCMKNQEAHCSNISFILILLCGWSRNHFQSVSKEFEARQNWKILSNWEVSEHICPFLSWQTKSSGIDRTTVEAEVIVDNLFLPYPLQPAAKLHRKLSWGPSIVVSITLQLHCNCFSNFV